MKTINLLYVLLMGIGVFISCSENPFDSTTDLGKDIIEDFDSTITDFDRNFKTVQLELEVLSDTTIFLESGDFPAGVRSSSPFRVGIWENEKATTYLEFDGRTFLSTFRETEDSLTEDSLQLRLNFTDTLEEISLHVLSGTIDSSYSFSDLHEYETDSLAPDSILALEATFDLASLVEEIAQRIQDGLIIEEDNDEVDTTYPDVAFLIKSDSPVNGIQDANLTFVNRDGEDIEETEIDFQGALFDVNVIDADDNPVSSLATDRTAILAIDFAPLWDVLLDDTEEMTYQSFLVTELTIRADAVANLSPQDSAIVFTYALEPSIVANDTDLANLGSIQLNPDSTTAVLRIERFLNTISGTPETAYLHLPINSNANELFSKINWHPMEEVSIRAVLTTPR